MVFRTQVNQSNINIGIAFKLRGLESEPRSSSMNFMGSELATMIAFHWKRALFGERFGERISKNFLSKRLKLGTILD